MYQYTMWLGKEDWVELFG